MAADSDDRDRGDDGQLRARSHRLTGAEHLTPLIERAADARVVLLGEASHGTHEYYTWRHAISMRLVREAGFDFVAVEGDWPDCQVVNGMIKDRQGAPDTGRDAARAFRRWPTWMWGNEEVLPLWDDLRAHNLDRDLEKRVGFHGLDVYSLYDSLHATLRYLEEHDGEAAEAARRAYECMQLHGLEGQDYARSLVRLTPSGCQAEVVQLLTELVSREPEDDPAEREDAFDAEQNARVVAGAEHYYRTLVEGGEDSWNVRDRHMMDTLEELLDFYGSDSRGIVWAHNTHVGDARATDMAASGLFNLGELARKHLGRDGAFIVGFGSHRGSVVAGDAWEAPMRTMPVPPARSGSLEALLHDALGEDRYLLLDPDRDWGPLERRLGHRAIGVVYHPGRERLGNYVPTALTERYDAFVFLDETRALTPLETPESWSPEPPETWPSGI